MRNRSEAKSKWREKSKSNNPGGYVGIFISRGSGFGKLDGRGGIGGDFGVNGVGFLGLGIYLRVNVIRCLIFANLDRGLR